MLTGNNGILTQANTAKENNKVATAKEKVQLEAAGNSKYSKDSINNIRDLGGNLREWTLEASHASHRDYRDGNYYITNSPSFRSSNDPTPGGSTYGSRLILYIK